MAPSQVVRLEGPQPQPYIYPKTQETARVIQVPDYKVVNFNYLFDYARASGQHRDRLPLWNPMKKSKYVDPFTGKPHEPLPPILFDLLGQPAGWGITVADAYARGETVRHALIGADDEVLKGYLHIDVEITVEWPCFLHCKPFKMSFTLREGMKSRQHVAYMAAQAIVNFLNASAKWSVDPVNRYWAPRASNGIDPYNMKLVALVNTHEKHWRCDLAIIRPTASVPSDCSPTMLDPVQYKFF